MDRDNEAYADWLIEQEEESNSFSKDEEVYIMKIINQLQQKGVI